MIHAFGPPEPQYNSVESYEELPDIYQEPAIPPELKELAGEALATGKKSALAMRIILFPVYVVQGISFLAELPGSALVFGSLLYQACRPEARDILHGLNVVLGATKPGKALLKKWDHLLTETNFLLISGSVRAALGAKYLATTRPPELDSIHSGQGANEQWVNRLAEWRNARGEIRFIKWYKKREKALLQKWTDLINETDTVWGTHIELFEIVVRQINGPVTPLSVTAVIGRIPATWRQVQRSAEDYLSRHPEGQWPESQNKFARRLNTNSSTLRKAITKSSKESLLRSWDRQRDEWERNKRRTRSNQSGRPAVISLDDAPEPTSDQHEDEVEVRELLNQHSTDELTAILKDLFAEAMRKGGRPPEETEREWRKLKGESDDRERLARLIVLLRQQCQAILDTDPRARIRQRRRL